MTGKKHAPKGPLKARTDDPMAVSDPMEGRCTATSKQSGQRCRQHPIPGGTVCRFHGGGAPQVRAKAEERLRALHLPAIARLEQLMLQTEFPSVAIAAVKDALDRIQGKPIEAVSMQHSGEIKITHELPGE